MKSVKMIFKITLIIILITQFGFSQIVTTRASPQNAKLNRSRGINMLNDIKDVIKRRYYDKNYKGIDIDERFEVAKDKIKTLDHNWQIFRVIAQVVLEFNDSHTRFYPPGRANSPEYGFTLQMIGDKCFVTSVKKNSDAEKKGIKPGDVIVGIGEYNPTRSNLWVINYILYSLDPQEKLSLFLLDANGREKQVWIETKFKSIKERDKEARELRKKKTHINVKK